MSATNRGSTIVSQEFYPTPKATTMSILKEIDFTKVNSFLEPCRGQNHIFELVNVQNKSYCEISEGINYLTTKLDRFDLILTNPPFSLAQQFITKARTESDTVVMLQRINYLGSSARKKFWDQNPPTHLFVLANRPKFIAKCTNKAKTKTGKKVCEDTNSYQISNQDTCCLTCGSKVAPASDATEYAWFVWDTAGVITKPPGIYVI